MSTERKNRIIETRTVSAADLVANPMNWREHPEDQRRAIESVLDSIGWVDSVKVVKMPDGRFLIVDGHLRADVSGDAEIPVTVLDLTPEEVDVVLATFDPLGAMAVSNKTMLAAVAKRVGDNLTADLQAVINRVVGQLEEKTRVVEFRDLSQPQVLAHKCPKCGFAFD